LSKPLVVVESPTKVKTLKKYLGNGYNVAATVGHIKDLPQKELGVDVEKGFKPKYRTIPGKQKVVKSLRLAARDTTEVFLAPDPDREGEAIAWHAADILKAKDRKFHRVLFHELTKDAVLKALSQPEALNPYKYEAQQTRRILDRLVGYEISPLLWRKVKSGLSAGRVQSVAVRIICERERAIQAFEPEEYWSITADLGAEVPPPFIAKLVKKNAEKLKIPDEAAAKQILDDLENENFVVAKVVKKTVRRNPQPPFITSKLQQEAIRKLRFSAKKTMVVAQQLYEGIELGGETVGLITYMRTDSTRIAPEAAKEAQDLILKEFGDDYTLKKPRTFKNPKKSQDAHEAIRPTSVFHRPEKIKPYLSADQLALYTLIWKRFLASQMQHALINQNSIAIKAGDYGFTASGSTVKFPGFMALYMSVDEELSQKKEKSKALLPELTEGQVLDLKKITPKQHFTAPPPRFSEASLVKELEENGIGRPSTYANILSTIRDKGYVELLKGYFRPTELGFIVNDLIVTSFPEEFKVEFTARMEDDLDRVEAAEIKSDTILEKFYTAFKKRLEDATDNMRSMKAVGFPTGLTCPQCQENELHIKVGKNGHFLACSGYPDCRYSRNYTRDEKGKLQVVEPQTQLAENVSCDKCGSPMVVKQGKFGDFLACSGYPDCKNTRSVNGSHPARETGVKCPQPDCDGKIVERKSRRGKIFYGCSRYPDCTFATWDKPLDKPCPKCGAPFLVQKSTKRKGDYVTCLTKECGHEEDAVDIPDDETTE
jgi:DNA topoisomerase I